MTPLTINDIVCLSTVDTLKAFASQTPNDIALIAQTAAMVKPGGIYLEVGSRLGYSALPALLGNFDIEVYGVDRNPACGSWVDATIDVTLDAARHTNNYRVDDWNVKDRWHFLPGLSVEVAKTWRKPIDFLFIDGYHKKEAVLEDIGAWTPFLKKGSFLGFHDYINYERNDMGVHSAVDETIFNKIEWYFMGAAEDAAIYRKDRE